MTPDLKPTPRERLAASRRAIIRHMSKDDRQMTRNDDAPYELGEESRLSQAGRSFWLSAMARAIQTWWRQHPFSMAVDVARPVLGRYAQNQPLKLLAVAAGIGAVAVLIKPWRLLSVGGIALAAVKSAAVPSVLMSMFSTGEPEQGTTTDPRHY